MSNLSTRYTEKLREIPHIGKNTALYMGLIALGRIRKIDGVRDVLPEPYDFFNHSGNILSSVTTALVSSAMVSAVMSEKTPGRRTALMSAALVGGAAVNMLVETRTGLRLPIVPMMFRDSTPDPIDFGYGMAGAAMGGAMMISMQPKDRGR